MSRIFNRFLIAALFAATGCSYGSRLNLIQAHLEQINDRVRSMEDDLQAMRLRIKRLEDEQEILKEKIAVLKKRRLSSVPIGSNHIQDVPPSIPVQRLSPSSQEDFAVTQLPTEVRYQDLNVKYDRIDDEGDLSTKQVMTAASTPSKVPTKVVKRKTKDTPDALYQRGFQAYRHGDLDVAISLLSRFVELYPKHDLADNALYWIGECYYDRREFGKAKKYFTEVVTKYPDANKAPDALLKIGMCNEMQARFEDAKRIFKTVMLSYPNTQAARIAMDRIKGLR